MTDDKKAVKAALKSIERQCEQLTKACLVAIYASEVDEQIATGFLVHQDEKAILVTAKHSLYGKNYDENPLDKRIFIQGRLCKLADLENHQIEDNHSHDIAALYINEYPISKCISSEAFNVSNADTKLITIHGYLGRDFDKSPGTSTLKPAPWTYTKAKTDYKTGYVAMNFNRRDFKYEVDGNSITAPRPEGLSGCPMLDSLALREGRVSILGVFTDQSDARNIGFGASSEKILEVISKLKK